MKTISVFSVHPLPGELNKTNFQKDLLKFDAGVTDTKEHYTCIISLVPR